MYPISIDLQFSELMNQLRHLGAIRFVMMGVCGAFTIGLLTAHYSLLDQCNTEAIERAFYTRMIGIIVVILFAIFELSASRQYKQFADRAEAIEGEDGAVFKGKKVRLLGPVTLMSLIVYALLLVVWWFL